MGEGPGPLRPRPGLLPQTRAETRAGTYHPSGWRQNDSRSAFLTGERLAVLLRFSIRSSVGKAGDKIPHIGLSHWVWARSSRACVDLAFANWGWLVDI
jgi:hypothetical protein